MSAAKYEIDMTKGSIYKNILKFTIPLMLSNLLQIAYNAADTIVVGRWAGTHALSAVGATTTLTALLTNLFIGLSVGASVAISKCYGAGDMKALSRASHTTVTLGMIAGLIACIVGQSVCRPLLTVMGTPEDIIDLSVLYMRIIFIGTPASLVYNFGAAILRSVGDTRRPLYILAATGVVNVVLNLVLVINFHMSVAGVAIATSIANYLSAFAVLYSLTNSDAPYKISFKHLRLHKQETKNILAVGLPAGLQSSVFSIANTVVQSAVNSFGNTAIAGRAAAGNIESFVYTAMNSFYHATLTSVGQNYGAKQEKRVYKSIIAAIVCSTVVGVVLGVSSVTFSDFLLGIYITDSAEAVELGKLYILYVGLPYFLCGIMDIMAGALRGLGHSKTPAICSLIGACGFRLLWVFTVLPLHRSLSFLYLCWPISWLVVIAMHLITFASIRKKTMQKMYEESLD